MKFSVGRSFSDLGRELGSKWRALLLALILPAIAMSLLEVASAADRPSFVMSVGLSLTYMLVSALFAVTCHRIVLLGESDLPNRIGLYLDRRVVHYLLYSIAIGLVFGLGYLFVFLASMPFVGMGSTGAPAGFVFGATLWMAALILFGYFGVRLSMVLPDRAIGRSRPWDELFRMSRGNGWRLFVAVVIPPVLAALLGILLHPILDASRGLSVAIPNTLLVLVSAGVGVMAVSCAYRELLRLESEPPAPGEPEPEQDNAAPPTPP